MPVTLPWNRYVTGTMKLKIIYFIHNSVFFVNTGETYYTAAKCDREIPRSVLTQCVTQNDGFIDTSIT